MAPGLERLDTPANAHRNAALREQILDGRPVFEREMTGEGAVVLDGRQPTSVLVSRQEVERSSGPGDDFTGRCCGG